MDNCPDLKLFPGRYDEEGSDTEVSKRSSEVGIYARKPQERNIQLYATRNTPAYIQKVLKTAAQINYNQLVTELKRIKVKAISFTVSTLCTTLELNQKEIDQQR